jgi:hypothetical protein
MQMAEYLRVVLDIVRNGASQHRGELYRVSSFTSRPSQVSLRGTAQRVSGLLARLDAAWVTDFVAIVFGSLAERARTIRERASTTDRRTTDAYHRPSHRTAQGN